MKNPTLSDVAQSAGVSYATADRVINKRGNVAEKSTRKVRDAMVALGYVRNVAAANLSRKRIYRLAFLLPNGPNAFYDRIRSHLHGLSDHLAKDQISATAIGVDAFAVGGLKSCLSAIADQGFDGVAVVGLQSTELEAPIERLVEQGVHIIGLVSDLPKHLRSAYIGIDNVAAGRTAARLVGVSHGGQSGRIHILAGSTEAHDHADRLAGFYEVIHRDFPNLAVNVPVMTCDDPNVVKAEVEQAVDKSSGITALYNIGAGNAGLIDAMAQLDQAHRPFCVAHELMPDTCHALQHGHIDLVIDQGPDVEVNRALSVLKALIDGRSPPPAPDLVPTIYVRDNLPTDPTLAMMKDTSHD
ncbi:LacI family DNA-binding transcriptional regulator [Ascidiaceihabitans sp.]|uniref:LacI family DNA-binding transcriptional regulator n=1 Tax=Ascidiaceihabitans sp. TaxID=1872644 RepID=UPI003297DC9A